MMKQKLLLVTYDDGDKTADQRMANLVLRAYNDTYRKDGGRLIAVEDLYPDDEMGFNWSMINIDNWRDMDADERAEFAEGFSE